MNDWRGKSCLLNPREIGPGTRWRDYISDLAWSRLDVEPTELPEIAVDRAVFRVLLGLLPPRTFLKQKRA